jgi:hypothetical protein
MVQSPVLKTKPCSRACQPDLCKLARLRKLIKHFSNKRQPSLSQTLSVREQTFVLRTRPQLSSRPGDRSNPEKIEHEWERALITQEHCQICLGSTNQNGEKDTKMATKIPNDHKHSKNSILSTKWPWITQQLLPKYTEIEIFGIKICHPATMEHVVNRVLESEIRIQLKADFERIDGATLKLFAFQANHPSCQRNVSTPVHKNRWDANIAIFSLSWGARRGLMLQV